MGSSLATVLTFTYNPTGSACVFLALAVGFLIGWVVITWSMRDERKGFKDIIEADLSGLHTANDLMAEAWKTQQAMHKTAAEATGDVK